MWARSSRPLPLLLSLPWLLPCVLLLLLLLQLLLLPP
jgi:hypothetical protein